MVRRSPQTERLVEILELLMAGSPPLTIAEVARHLGIDKATCYPMLTELVRVGWLIRHPVRKTYQLGPRLVDVGRAAEGSVDVIDFSRPVLDELADATGLATSICLPSGDGIQIGEVRQPKAGRMGTLNLRAGDYVNFRPPLAAVLVAWSDPEVLESWIAQQPPAQRTAASRLRYLEVVAAVRRRGYGVEEFPPNPLTFTEVSRPAFEERHGHARLEAQRAVHDATLYPEVAVIDIDPGASYWPISINAPVFDGASQVVAALCVLDSPVAMSGRRVAEIGDLVMAAARRLTAQVGGTAPE